MKKTIDCKCPKCKYNKAKIRHFFAFSNDITIASDSYFKIICDRCNFEIEIIKDPDKFNLEKE